MKNLNVQIEVKDWIVKKNFEEKGRRGNYTTTVFAILKETPKALYVMLGTPTSTFCMWTPKSQTTMLKEEDIDTTVDSFHNVIDATGCEYSEILAEHKRQMSAYN